LQKDESIPLQSVKVLTDEFEIKPFLDFDRYVETIVRMIRGSEPNFSIGIYGEWGTGKTTLMKSIENALKSDKKNILTIWFNAWRYEREEQFALISLMKTIAYKMDEQPEKYEKAKQVFYKSIVTTIKGLTAKYVLPEKYVEE
jgi:predicted KAP-like P-loop ATPase